MNGHPQYYLHDAHRQYHQQMEQKRRGHQSAVFRNSLLALDTKQIEELQQSIEVGSFGLKNSQPSVRKPRKLQHKRRYSASPATFYNLRDESHLNVPPQSRDSIMAATTMPNRGAPSYYGAASEFYPLELDQPTTGFMTRSQRSNNKMPRSVHPGFESSPLHQKRTGGPYDPATLNRPRKLSSTVTVTPLITPNSDDARSRSMSWSEQTSIPAKEATPYTAWRPEFRHQQSPVRTVFRTHKRQHGELFAALPEDVLGMIMSQLKRSHLGKGSDSCATCWMRDLSSISTASRKCYQVARIALYEDIQLNGTDSSVMKKRHKLAHGARLVLLRRTLRANPQLAAIVRTLKVPSQPISASKEEYHNLVATIIMECPNFERLVGLHPRYDHTFSRLFHALSTRTKLKQMDWIIDAPALQAPQRPGSRPGSSSGKATGLKMERRMGPNGMLEPSECAAFFDHHVNWSSLKTLSIHCLPGATLAPGGLVVKILNQLPALEHLYLSRLPHAAFNDQTLSVLPPLKTLSLAHTSGITTTGLSAFATSQAAQGITKLTLRHINLDSLPTLVRILSNMRELEVLSLVQTFAPTLPEDTMIWLMPYLASTSLRKLHWDITSHSAAASAADAILARSISADGFPSLRSLRAPTDPEGIFQSLCRPVERAEIASDRFRTPAQNAERQNTFPMGRSNTLASLTSSSSSSSISSGTSIGGRSQSPMTPMTPQTPLTPFSPLGGSFLREASDLRESRLAAQGRLEAARNTPRFAVQVFDEDGSTVEDYEMAGFMGTIGSKIRYESMGDTGAQDEKGGLVDIDDVLGDGGEDISEREGCFGRWNMSTSGNVDRKEKEKWWHTERGRWTNVEQA
ncbi:hypothetical protein ACHAQH_007080 [Verticillium albo-atrum]